MTGDRLAIIGCGAVTRLCHLLALVTPGPFRLTTLVDRAAEHARTTADLYSQLLATHGVQDRPAVRTASDVQDVLDEFDAAIVATPPDSHVDIAAALVRAGKHVLVEKPVACSSAELARLHVAMDNSSAIAVPAHVRRLYPASSWVADVLASGRLGPVRNVRWDEGSPFSWPLSSTFTFGPVSAGGGLLNDLGPHILDLLGYWLGGPAEVISTAHNGIGSTGTELELRTSYAGVDALINLSRLRELSNTVVIEGERRTLRVDTNRAARYVEYEPDGSVLDEGDVPADPPSLRDRAGLFHEQLLEFRRAITGAPSRLPQLADIGSTIRLIEECHSLAADPLPRPWRSGRTVNRIPRPARVAVTGATGFIGSNVVEELLDQDAETAVTAIGHSRPSFARLAHLDPSRVGHRPLDIRDTAALRAAFDGSEVVVHAAYGKSGNEDERWSTTVDGMAAVVEAAKAAGVRRLIHISSMAVYDTGETAEIDEDSPRLAYRPDDRSYAQQKLAAERIAFDDGGASLEVSCLQPGVVYGPWGPKWTVDALNALRADNESLPSGSGGGICNAVYVLDVAAAVAFLATADGVDGECFLLSGPQPVSWGTFYDHYRAMLGLRNHGIADHVKWPDRLRRFYAGQTTIRTKRLSKAGFGSTTDLPAGMSQVASWATWAGLV